MKTPSYYSSHQVPKRVQHHEGRNVWVWLINLSCDAVLHYFMEASVRHPLCSPRNLCGYSPDYASRVPLLLRRKRSVHRYHNQDELVRFIIKISS